MYLKEIVATGFKSFADKIDLSLDNQITCIVGPNGSGKSNVVDAVRWVLGEQSVKSLRGDGAMSDVIFSGSKSRKALNVASVELVFDNSDHYLNFDFNEVSLKRKAYRSGENEYFLNGERCRLKDIMNLLLDTGIGKESFNIISQGEVDKILSHSSLERRTIIEEAAEVLKYKKRKEEALKKLDKTHDNLERVHDIIYELEGQVGPLKEQSEKAKEYLENKNQLEHLEVSLLSYDIYHDSEKSKILKEKRDSLQAKILELSSDTSNQDVSILNANTQLEKLQNQFSDENKKLLEVTEEVEKLNGERLLLREKNKATTSREEKQVELRNLMEEESRMKAQISILEEEIKTFTSTIHEKSGDLVQCSREKDSLRQKKNMLTHEYSRMDQELIRLQHQVDATIQEMESLSYLPNAVRKVLNEKKLTGIYDTIGNVVSCDTEFSKALDIAISSSRHFIITEDEESSKKAIQYLKEEKLGRATFFPLSVIEKRRIDSSSLQRIQGDSDFITVLSDVVKCDRKYQNIIENQLGCILVSPDIDSATRLSQKVGKRYKIITLLGDVVHVGGSMTGGSIHSKNSIITLKQELQFLEEQMLHKKEKAEEQQKQIQAVHEEIEAKEEEYFRLSKEEVTWKEQLTAKMSHLSNLQATYENIKREITSLKQVVDDTFDTREKVLLDQYYEKNSIKEKTRAQIQVLSEKIEEMKQKIDEASAQYKLKSSEVRNLEREKAELDIEISKLDVKLDTMLLTLNEEYSLTFEKARESYPLEMDSDLARSKVNLYKSNIKKLGMVNLASIEEFERVHTRYEFLCSQRDDLFMAEESLLEIMREMDEVIEEEFTKTYHAINEEFSHVFKELFGGGNAHLVLNDPDHMLTTGIDIVASPPGKKLSSISLLSGGEKTLTAISLLFAILNVRSVPFCLFDEVEAALDEANVETFGKYLEHYKNKTQFLIITHKKKTMEYADTLYGITMQESGVSKLVSVQLNERVERL